MTAPRHVFRWDLDKTYLRTEFDSVRDLIKSAIETAADKQAYPGATAMLRTLSNTDGYKVCIVSGSPTQMRTVLAAKLALDGVTYDEFVLKDNLRNILRGRFRALRAQIPYKLPALLAFVNGVTAAAIGAITGAVIVLARRSMTDVPTVVIAVATVALLLKFRKLQEPVVIAAAAVIGLVVYPILHS